jgi:phenylalanyl-tRNA synthetase alpha chain
MTDHAPPPSLEQLEERLKHIETLDHDALEAESIAILGRKSGALTAALRSIPTLPVDERRSFGAAVNALKTRFEEAFESRRAALAGDSKSRGLSGDLSMPGRQRWVGAVHPVNRVVHTILGIFRDLGFSVATGPEVEDEWYNFLSLNFPPDHPAMDMHDTMYLAGPSTDPENRLLLRTHTSPVQIRVMQGGPPPYRVVIPGVVYRRDPFDASHAPAFNQIEGLAVDEGIGFVDLKATLTHFAHCFFGSDVDVRFRPSFFPFTEPSAEMDIRCQLCSGDGCAACKGTGWMEILGCGMVHPRVLENAGVDSERYTGWAFGMGPARMCLALYGVPDIRMLYEGDVRLLSQFAGAPE